jgi:hypothetical protein
MTQDLTRAGMIAVFGMLVSLLPLAAGLTYLFRPSERLLTLMRPLSLATIFAALNTFLAGLAGVLRILPKAQGPSGYDVAWISHGLTESITPMFVAFGFLAAAWLCVAAGMRRTN